jgi:hypothetical protein
MIRVTTQTEAQAIRRTVQFCYLCGEALPELRRQKTVSTEHVLPRALLPEATPGSWPIVLDVHRNCEIDGKRESDSWIKLYRDFTRSTNDKAQQLRTAWDAFCALDAYSNAMRSSCVSVQTSFRKWIAACAAPDIADFSKAWIHHLRTVPISTSDIESQRLRNRCITLVSELFDPAAALSRGHYRNTPFQLETIQPLDMVAPLQALSGGENIAEGVWNWVRGMHSFLYNTFVIRTCAHRICGDTPWVSSNMLITEPQTIEAMVRYVHGKAELANTWDEICAWSGKVVYRSVWVTDQSIANHARCLWILDVRGSIESLSECRTRWCGFYDSCAVPTNAARMGDSELLGQ